MGKQWKQFIYLGSKIIAEAMKLKDACSLEEKLWPHRQHVNKQMLLYGFSSSHVWMWELDHKKSWVPKNWCFWTVVLEKTLESPLDCKEIKPVNLKEISPEYSLEGLMLKLKLRLRRRTDSLEKILMLGKIEGRRRRGQQRMGWLYGITNSMDMGLSKLRESVKDRDA